MARTIITNPDTGDYAGHFDADKAEHFWDGTFHNGQENVGRNRGGPGTSQQLYRTSGGRWVIRYSPRWEGVQDRYHYLSDAQAERWLIISEENDEALRRFFGEQPEEVDTRPVIGRPAIDGPEWKIKFPAALADGIDAAAEAEGIARAEWIRRACEAELSNEPASQAVRVDRGGFVTVNGRSVGRVSKIEWPFSVDGRVWTEKMWEARRKGDSLTEDPLSFPAFPTRREAVDYLAGL